MRFAVFDALQRIYSKWPTESPKIVEKLLAISFGPKRGGFEIESRSVEGVDIGLVRPDEKYAVEVKTTSGRYVILQEKDVEGLADKARKDGYLRCVAVLRLDLLEEWVIADASRLSAGDYTTVRLSLDSIPTLEAIARVHFERTFLELFERVLDPAGSSPLKFLAGILAKESQP